LNFIMSFPGRAAQRAWHIIDASSQTVGRLATTVAPLLKGKHKPTYRPNADIGDYVVIVNAEKVSERVALFGFRASFILGM
jgi:large subunit ribosomal protein L13